MKESGELQWLPLPESIKLFSYTQKMKPVEYLSIKNSPLNSFDLLEWALVIQPPTNLLSWNTMLYKFKGYILLLLSYRKIGVTIATILLIISVN